MNIGNEAGRNGAIFEKSGQYVDYLSLGNHIRRLRGSRGFTQEDMGEKAEISASFYGHIERGSRKASIETLVRIAHALNCRLDDLLVDSLPENYMGLTETERAFVDMPGSAGCPGCRIYVICRKTEIQS